MELYKALFLGFIQGITEFLPVSSSGHLVIFQQLAGVKTPEIFFDICLHLGTLAAIIFYFRKDLAAIIVATCRSLAAILMRKQSITLAYNRDPAFKMAVLIIIGTIPTGIIGVLFSNIAEMLFTSLYIAGSMLLVTGLIMWLTRYADNVAPKQLTFWKVILIGIVQGFAVLPGISRSGSTIAVALFVGIDRATAARYSFLMSIPAIAGAAILHVRDIHSIEIPLSILAAGMIVSTVTGYLALSFLVYIVNKGRLYFFAPYCWLVGAAAIAFGYFNVA